MVEPSEQIWMDGKLVPWAEAHVHVLTHGLHYGTGVFEGIRCYETEDGPRIFRLRDHMQRLLTSGVALQMRIPYSLDQLCDAAKEVVRVNRLRACYIRPIAYYASIGAGLNPLKNPSVSVAIAAFGWGAYLGEKALREGVRVMSSSWRRISNSSSPANAKVCGNYVNSVLAAMEASLAGFDEAIMYTDQNVAAEGSGENLFLVKDGALATPGLNTGILPGVTRATVLTLARDLGYPVEERPISRGELYLADELFFTGTAAEVTPIRELDHRLVGEGKPGPITRRLQEKFFAAVKGHEPKYQAWLEPV